MELRTICVWTRICAHGNFEIANTWRELGAPLLRRIGLADVVKYFGQLCTAVMQCYLIGNFHSGA